MKKNDISLEEQWKCVSNILERVQKRGGTMLLIEQEILLNQLQGMYHGILDCAVVAEQPYSPAEVAQRLAPAAPTPQPEGEPLPAPTPAAELDRLIAAMVACYTAEHPVAIEAPASTPSEEIREEMKTEVHEEPIEPVVPQFAHVPEEERITFHQPSMEELEGEQNKELFEEEPAVAELPTEEPTPVAELAEPVVDPTPQPAVPELPQPLEPAKPAAQPKAEPSLFDLLNQSRGTAATATTSHTLGEALAQPAVPAEPAEEPALRNKVADLRTIININDKFSFMGELFHNNMKGYNDFISHLNALSGRDEALAYVAEIAKQYKWSDESIAVKTFYAIFDRKF